MMFKKRRACNHMPKAFRHLATGYQKAESSYIRNKLSGYVPSHYQNMLTPRSTTILQTSYTLHDSSGRGPVKGWNSMAPNSCALNQVQRHEVSEGSWVGIWQKSPGNCLENVLNFLHSSRKAALVARWGQTSLGMNRFLQFSHTQRSKHHTLRILWLWHVPNCPHTPRQVRKHRPQIAG